MAEKIAIIADSSSDVPKELVEKYDNIEILPVQITIDDKSFRDFYDIDADKFCDFLKNSDDNTQFSTAQVNVETFLDAYRKWSNAGYKIIVLTISSAASGTLQSANLAKQYLLDENPDAVVEIIDSKTYSFVYGRAVLEAARMAKDGCTMKQIIERATEICESGKAFFVVDTLKFLKKGGRVKPAVALIGEILNIKPVLIVEDGLINSIEKIRGSKRVIPRILELLKESEFKPGNQIYVIDSGDPELLKATSDAVSEALGIEKPDVVKIGPTILLNTGPGVAGVIYYTKP